MSVEKTLGGNGLVWRGWPVIGGELENGLPGYPVNMQRAADAFWFGCVYCIVIGNELAEFFPKSAHPRYNPVGWNGSGAVSVALFCQAPRCGQISTSVYLDFVLACARHHR